MVLSLSAGKRELCGGCMGFVPPTVGGVGGQPLDGACRLANFKEVLLTC